jgi:hypothetical protein
MTEAKDTTIKTSGPIGMTHPSLASPKRIPFGTIKVSPERFQVRNPKAASYVKGVIKELEGVGRMAKRNRGKTGE